MASARLYCTFLLLYLQGIQGQQVAGSNQNVGANNNAMALQQQAMQRINVPNTIQNQNGGANYNYPQQTNFQQGNMQQAANYQGNIQQQSNQQSNMQQQLNQQGNLQAQGGLSPFNVQVMRPQQPSQPDMSVANPKLGMTPQGAANSGFASISSLQLVNGAKSNGQAIPPPNMGPSNIPTTQTSNSVPVTVSSYAESMKNQPSLLSFIGPQNNFAPNQQVYQQNPMPSQNQLTDIQKQMLVRSLQAQQPVNMQNYLGFNPVQSQPRIANHQYIPVQGQQPASYQSVVPPVGKQPALITVQAQPLSSYLQNQYSPAENEEASLMSLILSQLQPSSPLYPVASAYATPKKAKSSLKSLIPLIINLLKDRNGCGCQNCGQQNECSNNKNEQPMIFGGYSNQKNYSEKAGGSLGQSDDKAVKDTAKVKKINNYMNNVVSADTAETYSEENDFEYEEYEET